MKKEKVKIGEFIEQIDIRNTYLSVDNLYGVSIDKKFIKSIANTIGTDMSNYKIVKKGQFAYGTVTSRNGDKVSIALLEDDQCIISSSYIVFKIAKEEKIEPEYLMLYFKRPEFDRYARFKSHGSAREIFDWDEMCNIELDIPSIEEQRKKVNQYNVINNRINILRKINDNLEAQCNFLIQNAVQKSNIKAKINDLIVLFDNLRKPMSSIQRKDMKRIYPYYGAASLMDYVENYIFDGIYGLLGEDGTVITEAGYPIMQYVWGKFWVNNHAHVFQGKNNFSTEIAYLILKNTIIRDAVTGAVQLKINQENLLNLSVLVPNEKEINSIKNSISTLYKQIRINIEETIRLDEMISLLFAKLSNS